MMWRAILPGSLRLVGVRTVSKLATVAVMVAATRFLGPSEFGVFSGLIAVSAIAGQIADFGLVLPTIRAVSLRQTVVGETVSKTLGARAIWSLVAIVLGVAIAAAIGLPPILGAAFAVNAACDVTATGIMRSFEGRQEMKPLSMFVVLERAIFASTTLGALFLNGSLVALAIAYVLSGAGSLLLARVMFQRSFGKLHLGFDRSDLRLATVSGFPFLVAGLLSALYYRVDTMILTYFHPGAEVGYYGAALRVFDAQMFVPMSMMASVFPALSSMNAEGGREFRPLLRRTILLFAGIGATLGIVVAVGAGSVVRILFSGTYEPTVPLLIALAPAVAGYSLSLLLGQALVAVGQDFKFTAGMAVTAGLSIAAWFFIIPEGGAPGAALVRSGGECVLISIWGTMLWRVLRKSRARGVPGLEGKVR